MHLGMKHQQLNEWGWKKSFQKFVPNLFQILGNMYPCQLILGTQILNDSNLPLIELLYSPILKLSSVNVHSVNNALWLQYVSYYDHYE